ncbi:MAG: hypothetical protein LBM75_04515 [Myxococcales bacterium]|nr:hypothetical protein [Myxococcales bacterium]
MAQTVTITGRDDQIADGNVTYTVTATASSADANYNVGQVTTLSVTNTDNETPTVIVTPTNGLVLSPGSPTRTFSVVLDTQPCGNVTIGLTSANPSLVSVAPSTMTFTTANWSTPQTATVTGIVSPFPATYTGFSITTTVTSGACTYAGVNPSDVSGGLFFEAEFPYTTCETQTITLGAGTYKLEVWGAQGGKSGHGTRGGYGGYSVGNITLSESTTIYVNVGGTPISRTSGGCNGGGIGGAAQEDSHSGGGATDIRINSTSLYARVIVAGGGGASGCSSSLGGEGGGLVGLTNTSGSYLPDGTGGTQTSGGISGTNSTNGGFGYGGNTGIVQTWPGGAGGGGWYGGGAGSNLSGGGGVGAGGSGWIYTASAYSTWDSGNHSDAVQYLLDDTYYLSEAQTIAGNTSFPAPGGGTETGHAGNGYARISLP